MSTPDTSAPLAPGESADAASAPTPAPAPDDGPASTTAGDPAAPPADVTKETSALESHAATPLADVTEAIGATTAPELVASAAEVAALPELTTAPNSDAILTSPFQMDPPKGPEPELVATARQVRLMTRLLIGIIALVCVVIVGQRLLEPTNLAAGKPWRTSSKWIDCDPSIGRCGPHVTRILFHTNEDEAPWFEVDLGAPTAFSSVSVQNRSDHMPERAVPLIVESSDDQLTWKELARRDETFSTWRAKFPTTTARFVRLRVPRRSFLHLEAVRVHP